MKHIISNSGHAVRNYNTCQACTLTKRMILNTSHTIRHCDTSQTFTPRKRPITNTSPRSSQHLRLHPPSILYQYAVLFNFQSHCYCSICIFPFYKQQYHNGICPKLPPVQYLHGFLRRNRDIVVNNAKNYSFFLNIQK